MDDALKRLAEINPEETSKKMLSRDPKENPILKMMADHPEDPGINNKSTWGPGPWIDEPDREEFTYKGLECLILRRPTGYFCGYVRILKHNKHYKKRDTKSLDYIDVHGDVTYACRSHPETGKVQNGCRWIGFDCAHMNDIAPKIDVMRKYMQDVLPEPRLFGYEPTYKDIEFVRNEVKKLADQLADEDDNGNR